MFFFLIDFFYPNSLRYTAVKGEYLFISEYPYVYDRRRDRREQWNSGCVPGRWDDAGELREIREDVVHIWAGAGAEQTDGSLTPVQPGEVLSLELLPRVPGLPGDL